jgi:hypothetical protein
MIALSDTGGSMKPLAVMLAIIAPGLLAGTLAACSAKQEHRSSGSQSPSGPVRGPGASAGGSGAAGSTGSGSGQTGAGMPSDQAALCELSRRIMDARSPEERLFMMDLYLPDMSPEMREWHLQQMRKQCR